MEEREEAKKDQSLSVALSRPILLTFVSVFVYREKNNATRRNRNRLIGPVLSLLPPALLRTVNF